MTEMLRLVALERSGTWFGETRGSSFVACVLFARLAATPRYSLSTRRHPCGTEANERPTLREESQCRVNPLEWIASASAVPEVDVLMCVSLYQLMLMFGAPARDGLSDMSRYVAVKPIARVQERYRSTRLLWSASERERRLHMWDERTRQQRITSNTPR
jgi:hypothetical protein